MILAHLTQTDLPDLILLVGVGFVAGFGTAVAALRYVFSQAANERARQD